MANLLAWQEQLLSIVLKLLRERGPTTQFDLENHYYLVAGYPTSGTEYLWLTFNLGWALGYLHAKGQIAVVEEEPGSRKWFVALPANSS
jgi:hypothetical protein